MFVPFEGSESRCGAPGQRREPCDRLGPGRLPRRIGLGPEHRGGEVAAFDDEEPGAGLMARVLEDEHHTRDADLGGY